MSRVRRAVGGDGLLTDAVRGGDTGQSVLVSGEISLVVLRAAPVGIVISDREGRVALANAAADEMFGYARAELIGQSLRLLFSEPLDDTPTTPGTNHGFNLQACPEGPRRCFVGRRKDGTSFPVAVGLRLVHTRSGILAIICVVDISDRRRAEQELRASREQLRALAEENARLSQEVQERERQVGFLLKEIIDAQEAERERICMEVHDGVAQTLTAAFGLLQALEGRPGLDGAAQTSVARVGGLVRSAIREAREVVATLRPATLDTLGLVATLRQELDNLREQTGLDIKLDTDPVRFPKAVETALYRIVHEALSNVVNHAHASRVTVRVKRDGDVLVTDVQDDGAGFDVSALERQPLRKGVGLLSMRKRAELLQGSFGLQSAPGEGTCVRVVVPVFS